MPDIDHRDEKNNEAINITLLGSRNVPPARVVRLKFRPGCCIGQPKTTHFFDFISDTSPTILPSARMPWGKGCVPGGDCKVPRGACRYKIHRRATPVR